MITIAVVNSKGGVGRTTLTAALAVRAAQEKVKDGNGTRNARVCAVDLDPQKSLIKWWKRRGRPSGVPGSPEIFEGVDDAFDGVERAERDGWEWCFLDGPPAFLVVIEEMVAAADFVLIPVKPSTSDLLATEDAVVLARNAGTDFLCVFNDVGPNERIVDKAREMLFNNDVPIADEPIIHRVSHITGMNAGKTAAEVNAGKDKKAAEEIEDLWQQVKAAAIKAAKARAKAKAVAHG